MSKSIRSYPKDQRVSIVKRRLDMLKDNKFKPGLGVLAAIAANKNSEKLGVYT